jgi:ribosomal protein L24
MYLTKFFFRLSKVAIIAGKDKDTIGEIKSVDRKRNLVVVDGKKLVRIQVKDLKFIYVLYSISRRANQPI